MLYLIDGYNVTKADPATRALSLEEQREALIARVRARSPRLLGPGRTVIVFDGEDTHAGGHTYATPAGVRFSRGESADDLIVRLAENAEEPVCLVSADAGLVRRLGAKGPGRIEVRDRAVLFEAAKGRSTRSGAGGIDRDSLGVPPGGNSITRELADIWLQDEE